MESQFQQLADQQKQPQSQPTPVSAPAATPTPTPLSTPAPASGSMDDQFQQLSDAEKQQAQNNQNLPPNQSGEITNDVGNTVIVPKDGESFSDTLKRAVAYHNSLTPEQRQAAIDKEVATMPKKTAQTLGAAATIGVVGPALLAAPGEIAEALPSVLTHTIDGVRAIGTWATKNPAQAYLLFQVMKELVPHAKKAMGVIKGVPEVE